VTANTDKHNIVIILMPTPADCQRRHCVCFRAVPFVHPYRCYHDISWTHRTVWIKLTGNIH